VPEIFFATRVLKPSLEIDGHVVQGKVLNFELKLPEEWFAGLCHHDTLHTLLGLTSERIGLYASAFSSSIRKKAEYLWMAWQ
jgi:hypothetical protein